MASSAEWQQRPVGVVPDFDDLDLSTARTLCTTALSQRGNGWMTTEETRSLLRAVKLPVQPGGVALTADEAVAVAEKIGWPVAVKLASHQIVHKTEFGGVHLNLTNERSVRHAFASITSELEKRNTLAAMEGVLVQPMLTGGVEVMVGVTHDPLFGPLIAFGLGGIHVEILGDVQFRITPLTEDDAIEMIRGIKGYSLLRGYRNQQPADTQALEEVLLRISRLVEEIPEIYELDLNPIFALPPGEGCRILDARIGVSRLTAGLANR
jgi:acyl-CoA synthetase (NDP forming)